MPTVNLVPLSLGELLDQTFSTFRRHFWLFAGIMVLPEAMMVGINIVVQIYLSGIRPPRAVPSPQAAAQAAVFAMRSGLITIGSLIPHFIIYALALGAATYALSEVYLGRTTTIRGSYNVVYTKLWRILKAIFAILVRSIGAFVVVIFVLAMMTAGLAPMPQSMLWVKLLVGLFAILGFILSGVLAIVFLVRYSVAVPALVIENLSTRQALKRSVELTKGYLWRLLVVGMLMTLINMVVVSLFQAPFTVAALVLTVKGARPGLFLTIPSLLLGGVGSAAIGSLFMISYAIAYYDLRVRKEGFDLQLMMSQFDNSASRGSPMGQLSGNRPLEDASVLGMCFLTIVTGGMYQPIWFLMRRKALNNLRSPEKLGILPLLAALVLLLASFLLPILGSIKWGSWVEAENALGPAHPAILLLAGAVLLVESFKVRRILLDHLAPGEEGMFASSIRFEYEELFSKAGTIFFGSFYLQHKINSLLERFTADPAPEVKVEVPIAEPSPAPPVTL